MLNKVIHSKLPGLMFVSPFPASSILSCDHGRVHKRGTKDGVCSQRDLGEYVYLIFSDLFPKYFPTSQIRVLQPHFWFPCHKKSGISRETYVDL